jgi:hypothetical protein
MRFEGLIIDNSGKIITTKGMRNILEIKKPLS